MDLTRTSLSPIQGASRSLRQRLDWRGELVLAILPTVTVLVVFGAVEVLSRQRLLFSSLASSAFLIYLDPQHGTNQIRTLVAAQMLAALLGFVAYAGLGGGYWTAGCAMLLTIILMITLDAMHPPAVATALSFAFRADEESNLVLFVLALGITAVLVVLEQATLWILARLNQTRAGRDSSHPGRPERTQPPA